MQDIVILGGPNGAGKTTAARELAPEKLGIREFVNADEIAWGLSPFNSEHAAVAAGRLMIERMRGLAHDGRSFAFETRCAGRGHVGFLRTCKSRGWRVSLLYLWLPSPEAAVEGRKAGTTGRPRRTRRNCGSAILGRPDECVQLVLAAGRRRCHLRQFGWGTNSRCRNTRGRTVCCAGRRSLGIDQRSGSVTELTNRQILDAMRAALEETARKLGSGELDRTGMLGPTKPRHPHPAAPEKVPAPPDK